MRCNIVTRGFITIATGKEQYYRIAANLVTSYRMFCPDPLPFAVITEEENQYTALFDDVIVTTESTHSFMDKFLLMKLCPYDENIFIDADSLCYGDLNVFWSLFEGATDFSAFGINADVHDRDSAWYYVEDIWKYGEMIPYKCRVHAGVMFIRNTEKLQKLYDDSMEIYSNYDKLHFHTCPTSYDECVLGISMPMNGMKAVKEDSDRFACYPFVSDVKTDMFTPDLSYVLDSGRSVKHSILLHFGTFYTKHPQYLLDVQCLQLIRQKKGNPLTGLEKLLYQHRIKYPFMRSSYEMERFVKRVINKIFQQHKDI